MIIARLRQTLLSLFLLASPLAAQAETPDNLPVALQPNQVDLEYDARAVFAASGSRLIVTDEAGTYVFDVGTGRFVRKISFDNYAKTRVLSPSEDVLISGHMDGTIRLWSLATGAPAGVLQERAVKDETHEITALAVTQDGASVVSGSDDGTISVWDLRTKQKSRSFAYGNIANGSSSRILALRLSKDAKALLAVTRETARTFDFATGRQLFAFALPNDKSDVTFARDSIVSDDGLIAQLTAPNCDIAELRYIDLKDPTNPVVVDKPADCKRRDDDSSPYDLGAPSLYVNPARPTVWIARAGVADMKEWDLTSHTVTRTIKWTTDGKPIVIGVDKDFAKVAVTDNDRLSVREFDSGTSVAAFDTNTFRPRAVVLSKDGKSILLAQPTSDKGRQQLTLWEIGAPDPAKVLLVPADNETTIRDFSRDAKLAAAVTNEGFVLLSLETGEEVRRFTPKEIKTPWIIRLSPDGKLALLSGDNENNDTVTLLIDATDGSVKQRFALTAGKDKDSYGANISDAAFSPDGKRLAIGHFNGTAEIWDVASRKRIKQLPADEPDSPGQIWSPTFSGDGKKLLTCSRDSGALLWTIDSGKPPRPFLFDDYAAMHAHLGSAALSHNGSMVAAGSAQHATSSGDSGRERSIKIWNAATGKLRKSWLGHEDGVTAVTFTPDDRMIVSASRDGTVKYWDAESGKAVASIISSNDGHWVVLASSGLFSGNGGDSHLFNFARGFAARPSTDFKDELYKPDLIAELLKGDPNHRYAAAAKQLDLKAVWDSAAQ